MLTFENSVWDVAVETGHGGLAESVEGRGIFMVQRFNKEVGVFGERPKEMHGTQVLDIWPMR